MCRSVLTADGIGGWSQSKQQNFLQGLRLTVATWPSSPDQAPQFTDWDLHVKALTLTLEWQIRAFIERGEWTEEDRGRLEQQVESLTAAGEKWLQQAFPPLGITALRQTVRILRTELEARWQNPLDPGLKRLLSPAECEAVQLLFRDFVQGLQPLIQRQLQRIPSHLSAEERTRQTEQIVAARAQMAARFLAGAFAQVTSPPLPAELNETFRSIGDQQRQRTKQWVEQQQRDFQSRAIQGLLKQSVEGLDETLFILGELFNLRQAVWGFKPARPAQPEPQGGDQP